MRADRNLPACFYLNGIRSLREMPAA